MIKNKLSAFMGEKRINISEVARITGLSYTTVYKLYNDNTSGVDFYTLDRLCWALECRIPDLFEYIET
ncbi:MAG: helix-turn-helix transcriptional regulator [Heliobacteriaceae bacterium]|jgi:putative transcriptional regulator|nr:helix-turn-helix transcriptional regulator [Heliobacteriaceae bacterium]